MTHRVLRTVIGGLVVVLISASCQQAATGTKSTSETDKTAGNIVREFTIKSSDFVVGEVHGTGIAAISYPMSELTATVVENGLIHAYAATPSAPDGWLALPLTVSVRTVVFSVTYAFSEGMFEVGVTANVPAQALRAGLPSLNGWLVRVVIDTQ